MEKGTGTVNFWNTRKNFGVIDTGSVCVYVKRYQVTEPSMPNSIDSGDNVKFDRSIKGYDIKSTCDLTPKVKVKNESSNL